MIQAQVTELSSVFVKNEYGQYCLVLERDPDAEYFLKWVLPTKRMGQHETPLDAAYRAMLEEAGVRGSVTSGPYITEQQNSRLHYFTAVLIEDLSIGGHERKWPTDHEILSDEDIAPYVPQIMREMNLMR